jgi:hypothetical protein
MQAATYPAEQTRRTVTTLLQRGASIGSIAGGLVGSTDMQVTAGTLLQVLVGTGEAWVPGSSSAVQSGYYCRVTSSTALSIAASSESNPRIDTVIAKCVDESYAGSGTTFAVAVITGTAESGATLANKKGAGAVPASSLVLAYVLVPAKATSIEAANIENVATQAYPGLRSASYLEGTAAKRPAAGIKGRIYFATDTRIYTLDNGSEWVELSGGGAWSALTLVGGATAAYGYAPSASLEPGGRVRLKGEVVAEPSEIASLPYAIVYLPSSKYYPTQNLRLSTLNAVEKPYSLEVLTTGGIEILTALKAGTANRISLNGLSFTTS